MMEKNGIMPENNEWKCVDCARYSETRGLCEYCRYEPLKAPISMAPEPTEQRNGSLSNS